MFLNTLYLHIRKDQRWRLEKASKNRMWALPEAKGISRRTGMEDETLKLVLEGCNPRISWVQQCQNAHSAESVEMLREELVDSILWNEVNGLSDVEMQPELVSERKNWKHEVMKWFSTSHPLPSGGDTEQQTNDSPLPMGFQISRKRPKLEVRRAESHAFQVDTQGSHQAIAVEIDAGFFDGRGNGNTSALESGPPREEIHPEGNALKDSSGSAADRWGEIVVEAGNSEVIQAKDVEMTPVNGGVLGKSFDTGYKNRQCTAFIEAKGRQCVRWANDGDVYCCVHLASRFVGNAAKAEATPVDAPMCEGYSQRIGR